MVKLVEYPDSSEDEHPDVDTRSDGSQWSSFGQIPSDASDSLSFRMRSPESDSDEDYAPSQASLSSLEGSHSPVSSVDTNDLEFPSDMEEDEPQEPHSQAAVDNSGEGQNQPQETKEDGHNLFYAWGDLKAAFEDNPFKRRSVQKEESEDAEETSTESPGEQETGNQEEEKTQWSLPVTGKSLGAQDTDRISQRKIFRPRRQTGAATLKPSGVTPTFSNFSTDNQAEDGGLQWENKTQREKVVSTPGDTTTSMFTASSSGTQDAFSFGSKQAKVESPAASTTDYTFGTPSWGLFSSGSDDAHMMSPPVSTATSAPPSGGFSIGRSDPSPKPFTFARRGGHFKASTTNTSVPVTSKMDNSDGDDTRMRSPSSQANAQSDSSFAFGQDNTRRSFHFVEQGGNKFRFGPDQGTSNKASTETTVGSAPSTMPVDGTPTTRFGAHDAPQTSAFFSPGTADTTQHSRSRTGRRRKLNGSSSMFTSAHKTDPTVLESDIPPSVSALFGTAPAPSSQFPGESPFKASAGSTNPFTEKVFNNNAAGDTASPLEKPRGSFSGGNFLFRKTNAKSSRPSPLQTNAFGPTNTGSTITSTAAASTQFSFGTGGSSVAGETETNFQPSGGGPWFSPSQTNNSQTTPTGFQVGTTDTKAHPRWSTRGRHRNGGIFTNKNSPKRPAKPAVMTEPEPSPDVFSIGSSESSPFGLQNPRASKTARRRRKTGRSPPADPFVTSTSQKPQPSSSTEGGDPIQLTGIRPTANKFTLGTSNISASQSDHAAGQHNGRQSSVFLSAGSIRTTTAKPDQDKALDSVPSRPAFAGSRRILRAALRNVGVRSGPVRAESAPPSSTIYKTGRERGDAEMHSEDDERDWGELKRLGGAAHCSQRYADAAEYYRQSIEVLESILEHNAGMETHDLMTDKAKLHANRAASLMMLMQITEAQKECRRSIEVDATYARAYLRLGRIQVMLGDTANAQANLDTAKHLMAEDHGGEGNSNDQADHASLIKMEATIKKLVTLKGEIKWYVDCGDFKQALVHTKNALALAPSCRDLQAQNVRILLHQKEFGQIADFCTAIVQKQQAIYSKPAIRGGLNTQSLMEKTVDEIKLVGIDLGLLWATSLHYQNRAEDAIRIVNALEVVAPCSSHVIRLKRQWQDMKQLKHNGNEHFKRGEYQEAVRFYSEAVQIDGQHQEYCAVIYCNRAAAQMGLERYHTAILDCNEALQRKPKYPRALLRRARCHVALKMYHEAVKDFDRYLREHPADSSSDTADDVRRERNEAKAAIAKAREEARQREAAKKRAEREQRQQRHWGQTWEDSRFYDGFRRNTSSSGTGYRYKSSGPSGRASFMAPKTQRRTHYDVLGIEKVATIDQIKKAYRKLALVYHPDKAKTSTHAELFKEMTAAYNVLSDESARSKYDRELIYNRFGNFYES